MDTFWGVCEIVAVEFKQFPRTNSILIVFFVQSQLYFITLLCLLQASSTGFTLY